MYRLLETEPIADDILRRSLLSRILKVCKGHLDWCFDIAQKTSSDTWTSEYRPFGSRITSADDLNQGVANLLKLFDAWQFLPLESNDAYEKLARRLQGWLTHLEASRNKKSGLWEEDRTDERLEREEDHNIQFHNISVPRYELCQSILIWQTICAIRIMVDSALVSSSPEAHDTSRKIKAIVEESGFRDKFSPVGIRNLILDRFTFDHASPTYEPLRLEPKTSSHKGRLLAVSRKATEKPRFHWNTECVVLCDGYDGGFFDELTSMRPIAEAGVSTARKRIEQWSTSLSLQNFQHEALWKKPCRYVLALILASCSQFSMDNSMDPESLVRRCEMVLLQSISLDGRVAEKIEPMSKTPLPRSNESTDTIFQVPYLLLQQQYPTILVCAKKRYSTVNTDLDTPSRASQNQQKSNYRHGKSVRSLKKRGFYATVNEENIVEHPCEPDWIFDDPDIFTNESRPNDQMTLEKEIETIMKDLEDYNVPRDRKIFIENLVSYVEDNNYSFTDADDLEAIAVIDDVLISNENVDTKRVKEEVCWPSDIIKELRSKRERSLIKKRLM